MGRARGIEDRREGREGGRERARERETVGEGQAGSQFLVMTSAIAKLNQEAGSRRKWPKASGVVQLFRTPCPVLNVLK